jgi:hypothetical protein
MEVYRIDQGGLGDCIHISSAPSPHSGHCNPFPLAGLPPKGRVLHSPMRPVAIRCGFDLPLPARLHFPFILFAAFARSSSILPQPSARRRFLAVVPQLAHPSLSSLNVVPSPIFTFLSQPITFASAEHPIRPSQSRGCILTAIHPRYRFIQVANSNQ